jgi:hypothetical protein
VRGLSLVECPNSLVVEEFVRWMVQVGYLEQPLESHPGD